eukprot:2938144-Pyramimonas_sp.AAC.1
MGTAESEFRGRTEQQGVRLSGSRRDTQWAKRDLEYKEFLVERGLEGCGHPRGPERQISAWALGRRCD